MCWNTKTVYTISLHVYTCARSQPLQGHMVCDSCCFHPTEENTFASIPWISWFHLISLSESDQNFLATSSQPPQGHIVSEVCILECLLACIIDWGIQDVGEKPGKCKADVGEENHVGNGICGLRIKGGDSEKA